MLAKHPLNGLRFTNTTDLYLMQGPITVFDGGVYAGDARIEDLPPGGQRLMSYGIDLDTEVAPQSTDRPEELLSVRLLKGTAIITHKYARSVEYTVKNSGKRAKTVLIEYPIDPAWTLVSPKKPAEKTRDLYRFAVEAKPGEPAKLVVEQERTDRQQVLMTNLDQSAIQLYLSAKVVSDKVKAALTELVRRKHEIEQVVGSETTARTADRPGRRRSVPHPPEHGPARPHERSVQGLRQEAERPGDAGREASGPDRRVGRPTDPPAESRAKSF